MQLMSYKDLSGVQEKGLLNDFSSQKVFTKIEMYNIQFV